MSDKEFMWALKNGDLDEVKDYVAKVGGGGGGEGLGWARWRCGLRREGCARSLQGPPSGGRPGGAGGLAGTATCLGTGSWGAFRGGEGPGGRARFPSPFFAAFSVPVRPFSPAACSPPAPQSTLVHVAEVIICRYVKLSGLTANILVLPRRSYVYMHMCGLGLVILPLCASGLILNRVMLSYRVC